MKRFSYICLGLIICLAIGFRSWHYREALNFSAEQGAFAGKSWDIWREKSVELIGPPISFQLEGRRLFQGSVTYYFQTPFLLAGDWDPVVSSYLITIFGLLMIIPMYWGVRMLINEDCALVGAAIYGLLSLFIDYSRFMWNPNYQLMLMPLLVLMLGLLHAKKKYIYLFLAGLMTGVLLLFHYQIVVVGLIILVWLAVGEKVNLVKIGVWIVGAIIGFLPMLIFELRNNFYNLNTLFFYLKNLGKVMVRGGSSMNVGHYYLSIVLVIILFLLVIVKRWVNKQVVLVILGCLIVIDLWKYSPTPSHGFGMIDGWSYGDELKVYQIIRKQGLQNYNIVNLPYDTLAQVQGYLHKKDGVEIAADYYSNKYLFVVNEDGNYMNNPAYEVNQFKPSKEVNQWQINDKYNLYLLEREK